MKEVTWNVLHFQCKNLHSGIRHFDMDPTRTGSFYQYNLERKEMYTIILFS